jgi:hypothetical protein
VDRRLDGLETYSNSATQLSRVKPRKRRPVIHRSNPEQQIPFETNERMSRRSERSQQREELFNWEHVLCAVQHSAETLQSAEKRRRKRNIQGAAVEGLSDEGEGEGGEEMSGEQLEEMFFRRMNGEEEKTTGEDERLRPLEISPSLPPLHLTPTVVRRIESRLVALFGLSRDTIPISRPDHAIYREFDQWSPGYPHSS